MLRRNLLREGWRSRSPPPQRQPRPASMRPSMPRYSASWRRCVRALPLRRSRGTRAGVLVRSSRQRISRRHRWATYFSRHYKNTRSCKVFLCRSQLRVPQRAAYDSFSQSRTKEQKDRLIDQYLYARRNEGEKRPYADWEKISGIPAYFRGYAFKQWPDEFNAKAYTPEQ